MKRPIGQLATITNYREILGNVGLPAEIIPSFALKKVPLTIVRSAQEAEVVVPQVLSLSPMGEVLIRRAE